MPLFLEPIGHVRTATRDDAIPRHWSISDVPGTLEILPHYQTGLKDIHAGEQIIVLFHFDRSPAFTEEFLVQKPPHRSTPRGVFSICSPKRPNPIGLSILEVLSVEGCRIHVKGVDMFDGTPILDIKPYRLDKGDYPSSRRQSQGGRNDGG